jgi:hypothetical protein
MRKLPPKKAIACAANRSPQHLDVPNIIGCIGIRNDCDRLFFYMEHRSF